MCLLSITSYCFDYVISDVEDPLQRLYNIYIYILTSINFSRNSILTPSHIYIYIYKYIYIYIYVCMFGSVFNKNINYLYLTFVCY